LNSITFATFAILKVDDGGATACGGAEIGNPYEGTP
jgi:hypothetical protein